MKFPLPAFWALASLSGASGIRMVPIKDLIEWTPPMHSPCNTDGPGVPSQCKDGLGVRGQHTNCRAMGAKGSQRS